MPAIAAIGIILCALIGWRLIEWENQSEAAYEASRQQYEESKQQLVPGATIDGNRTTADPKSYREEWRSERDLEAQRKMARWTFWMVLVSGLSVVVAIVAVVLVYGTLRETRLSNQRQLRAYIFVDSAERTRRSTSDPWEYHLNITNFGQTPAYRLRLQIGCKLIPDAAVKAFDFQALKQVPDIIDLGPGHSHTVRDRIPGLYDDGWRDFKGGKLRLFLWGRVDFIDAFDQPRWMRFRLYQFGSYHLGFANYREGNDTSESQQKS